MMLDGRLTNKGRRMKYPKITQIGIPTLSNAYEGTKKGAQVQTFNKLIKGPKLQFITRACTYKRSTYNDYKLWSSAVVVHRVEIRVSMA